MGIFTRAVQIAKDPWGIKPRVTNLAKGGSWANPNKYKDAFGSISKTFSIPEAKASGTGGSDIGPISRSSIDFIKDAAGKAPTGRVSRPVAYRSSGGGGGGGSSRVVDVFGSTKKSKDDDYNKQIKRQREEGLAALDKRLKAARANAANSYEGGISQIDALLNALGQSFSGARGRLDMAHSRGIEEFNKEKVDDINAMKAFYAAIGVGDSEQAGQGYQRTNDTYANRLLKLEQDYLQGVQELESERSGREAEYGNKKVSLRDAYENELRNAEAGQAQGQAQLEGNISNLLKDLRDYALRERALDLDAIRTQYQVSKPYFAPKTARTAKMAKVKTGFGSGYDPTTGAVQYYYDDEMGNRYPVSLEQYRSAKFPQYDFGGGGGLGGEDDYSDLSDEELWSMATSY